MRRHEERIRQTCNHLEETGSGRVKFVEANRGRQSSVQGAKDEGDDSKDRHSPPRQAGVAGIVGLLKKKFVTTKYLQTKMGPLTGLRNGICCDKDQEIPPTGDWLVYFDLLVMLLATKCFFNT